MKRKIILILILLPLTCQADTDDFQTRLDELDGRLSSMEITPVTPEDVLNKALFTTYPEIPSMVKKMANESVKANLAIEKMASESVKANQTGALITAQLGNMNENLKYLKRRDVAKGEKDFEQDFNIKNNTKEIDNIKLKRERNSIEWQTRVQDFLGLVVLTLVGIIIFFGKFLFVKYKLRRSGKKDKIEQEENTVL